VVGITGTILAFADHRKRSRADLGHDTDTVVRRSTDGGRTWEPVQTLISFAGSNVHGGPALVDRESGRIIKTGRRLPALFDHPGKLEEALWTDPEKWIEWGCGDYMVVSDNDGVTWSEPERFEHQCPGECVGLPGVGNGIHGIQLPDGRLVMQGKCMTGKRWERCSNNPTMSYLMVSSDGGGAWTLGPQWAAGYAHQEFPIEALSDGRVYVNQRSLGPKRRELRVDIDDKRSDPELKDNELPEPICHASLLRVPERNMLLFCNPDVENHERGFSFDTRMRLSIHVSHDEGETWPRKFPVDKGKSAYSDLALAGDGTVLCLYENGPERYNDRISLARIDPELLS